MMGWANEIVGKVDLGDERLNRRLIGLLEAFVERPAASIPDACGDWAATQAAYRFFGNEAVDPGQVVLASAQATAERCRGLPVVLAVQDTTSLNYTTHTDTSGLGPLANPKGRGLFIHTAIAVEARGGVPLGVISQHIWVRDPEELGKKKKRSERPVEAKESARWLVSLKETEARLGPSVRVLTVADREADVYELFALAHVKGDWLIRTYQDRRLVGDEGSLLRAVEGAPVCARTTVELPRTDKREARLAKLEVRRAQVMLKPPEHRVGLINEWWAQHPEVMRLAPEELSPVRVGLVLVQEVDVSPGVEPVRWLLMTSLPVETVEEALLCIEYYRLRWLVERYHYVLKSGCQVEKLQLETADRLQRALVVYSEVAWRLLSLTYRARANPDAPCTVVFDEVTWQVLWLATCPKVELPLKAPSLHTAVRQVAMLGGFLGRKGDGEPGVKTLWRGLRRLNDMVEGYCLATRHSNFLDGSAAIE